MKFESVKNWFEAYITNGWMMESAVVALNTVNDRPRIEELKEMACQYLDGEPIVTERAEKVLAILLTKEKYIDLTAELEKELKD